MKKVLISIVSLSLGACATSLSTEERLHKRNLDAENWYNCKLAYNSVNRPTLHKYRKQRGIKPRPHQIKEDLALNNCRQVLGEHWADV